ncbi:MAG: S24/S26 family peptidase [Candidatus Didemnitutus sp.]|nr:S24/S26 family peptidase [Candidatus Didemnitutus sp.]
MTRRDSFRLAGWLVVWACVAVGRSQAFDETRDPWIRGVYTAESPRPLHGTAHEAWLAAQDCLARTPGAFLLVGSGNSMQPLYPPGSVLILREVAYAELRRGQTVVYRNQRDRAVAHVLIAKARDGWRVRGLNNRTHDLEPVVADNLIGVVVAAFSSEEPRRLALRAGPQRAIFLDERDR